MKRTPWLKKVLVALLIPCLMVVPIPIRQAQAASATYRALLIGNNAYQRNPLRGCINDAKAIRCALLLSTDIEYARIELMTDLTSGGLTGALDTAKDWGQRADDVTLIYYSGHGYSNVGGAGIIGTDMVGVPFSAVEARLAKIPGTVCVVIDSCYSGALINKSTSKGGATARDYNDKVVAAFKSNATSKALNGSKYHVITACSMTQQSFEAGGYGYFTTGVTEAMGWNATAGKAFGALIGDANENKQLTVGEAYTYAYGAVNALRSNGDQSVRVAPENSNLVMVARTGDEDAANGKVLPGVSGLANLTSVVMARGWSYQLTSAGAYSWKSTNETIASVSSTGVVTAYREGKAMVIGTRSGYAKITLQVEVAALDRVVQKVKLNVTSGVRKPGKSFTLKAALTPSGVKNKGLKWYSTDNAVATVSKAGKVMPQKAGTCKIYAIASSGAVASCEVTVPAQAVTKVQQKRANASVGVGKVLQLQARALPTTASNRQLKWTSSDERIAVIGEDSGIVRGLRKGKVYVTAAAMDGSGIKSKCLVTVK